TYLEPSSLDEALALLSQHGDEAKLIAGGTGLVNLMKQRLARPAFVIGLRALKPLTGFAENGGLRIGALTTLGAIDAPPPGPPARAASGRNLRSRRDRADTIHGDTRRRDGTCRSQPRYPARSYRPRCTNHRALSARHAHHPGRPVFHRLFRNGARA